MRCPECGNKCKKGFVQARKAGSITQSLTMLNWYHEEDRGKFFKLKGIKLAINGDGYYCDQCMKVYAVFEEK